MDLLHSIICLVLISAGFMVSFSKNPVQSVLFLIMTFCLAGASLILFQSEFFGLVFVIIYVGAIAVLFLFVIMMLNVKVQSNILIKVNYPLFVVFGCLVYSVVIVFYDGLKLIFSDNNFNVSSLSFFNNVDGLFNIDVLGQVLYNYYYLLFLLAGLILLVALIGSVVLTLKFNEIKKTQSSEKQLSRKDNYLSFFS